MSAVHPPPGQAVQRIKAKGQMKQKNKALSADVVIVSQPLSLSLSLSLFPCYLYKGHTAGTLHSSTLFNSSSPGSHPLQNRNFEPEKRRKNAREMRILVDTTYAPPSAATVWTPPAGPTAPQRSPWHSPVPYLFGGLAAMLGLIGFALLILACSYMKLSGSSSNPRRDEENGGEAKTVDGEGYNKAAKVYEEKIVVIMAGDEKPTFLATPVCSRGPSFGDSQGKSKGEDGESFDAEKKEKEESFDKTKEANNVNNDDVGGHVVHDHNSAAAEGNREAAEDQTQQQN